MVLHSPACRSVRIHARPGPSLGTSPRRQPVWPPTHRLATTRARPAAGRQPSRPAAARVQAHRLARPPPPWAGGASRRTGPLGRVATTAPSVAQGTRAVPPPEPRRSPMRPSPSSAHGEPGSVVRADASDVGVWGGAPPAPPPSPQHTHTHTPTELSTTDRSHLPVVRAVQQQHLRPTDRGEQAGLRDRDRRAGPALGRRRGPVPRQQAWHDRRVECCGKGKCQGGGSVPL